MARMRSIKPETFQDQDFAAELPNRDARLLYIGLWGLADEHARLRGDAVFIKGQLFSYDPDLTPEVIDGLIDMLEETGRAVRYRIRSSVYIHLPKLAKHQRLEPHKVPSRLPEPPTEQSEQLNGTPSEKIPDESAPIANVLSLRQAACSKKHVAGSSQQIPDKPPPGAEQAAQLVITATGIDTLVAAEVVLAIARERRPKNLPGLVQRIIQDRELAVWIDKANATIAAAADRPPPDGQARASPGECPHRMPAGLELLSTGLPRCPKCRLEALAQ